VQALLHLLALRFERHDLASHRVDPARLPGEVHKSLDLALDL